MAYPTYFPQYYPNPYVPIQPIQQQIQQPVFQNQASGANQTTQTVPKNEPQVQNGGFIPVPNEQFARSYPVANGISMTFKDENAPYVYTKTMGMNQLDAPIFTKYRLVKEEDAPVSVQEPKTEPKEDKVDNSLLDEINDKISQIEGDIDDIWKEINSLKEQPKKVVARKKDDEA